MSNETKRKFLVTGSEWRTGDGKRITQGYLPMEGSAQIRIRTDSNEARLTIKSSGAGLERSEFEYAIPLADAEALFHGFCLKPLIVKTRHTVEFEGNAWTIDAYEGVNDGLVVAELEMASPDASFARPPWLGDEVTGDARFRTENLLRLPYNDWSNGGTKKTGDG